MCFQAGVGKMWLKLASHFLPQHDDLVLWMNEPCEGSECSKLPPCCVVLEDLGQLQTLWGFLLLSFKSRKETFSPRALSNGSQPCYILRFLALLALGLQGLGLKMMVCF